jgi:hypothetical protein
MNEFTSELLASLAADGEAAACIRSRFEGDAEAGVRSLWPAGAPLEAALATANSMGIMIRESDPLRLASRWRYRLESPDLHADVRLEKLSKLGGRGKEGLLSEVLGRLSGKHLPLLLHLCRPGFYAAHRGAK